MDIIIPDPDTACLRQRYFVYDSNGRLINQYIAAITATNGDPCVEVTYTYTTSTGTTLQAIVESVSTWNSSWI